MNPPRAHHLVPRLYLQRFAIDDQVELINRDDFSTRFRTSVAKALVENNFYTIDTEAGKDTAVESMFARLIEDPTPRALTRIFDERAAVSLPGLRATLSIFLAFQFVRGPATRHASLELFAGSIRGITAQMGPEAIRSLLRDVTGGEPTDEEVQEIVDFGSGRSEGRFTVSNPANLHLGHVLAAVVDLVPFFLNRKWHILDFPASMLITGDEPVALVGESMIPGEPIGLQNAAEVVFPASPTQALVMARPDLVHYEGRKVGTKQMADRINQHVAFGCHRFLVQQPGTNLLDGMQLPTKAPPILVQGDQIVHRPRTSLEGLAVAERRTRKLS